MSIEEIAGYLILLVLFIYCLYLISHNLKGKGTGVRKGG